MTMRILDPSFSARRRLKAGLIVAGAVAGAVFGIALTKMGKLVAGAPPATIGNYAWNALVFGIMAAVVSPVVAWSALRRVPLWRTIVEPLAIAVAGGVAAVAAGAPLLLFVLPPLGSRWDFCIFAGAIRRFRDESRSLTGRAMGRTFVALCLVCAAGVLHAQSVWQPSPGHTA